MVKALANFMKYLLGFLIIVVATGGLFYFWPKERLVEIIDPSASSTITSSDGIKNPDEDDAPQNPLANPPSVIKAVYFTGWSAGVEDRVSYLTELIKTTELNAAVIDIKDYSGYVLYDVKLAEVEKYKAKEIRISKINSLIKRLHSEGIYVIARISVFQDPVLAKARPDLAIHSKKTGGSWLDNKKLAWIDPAAKEAWDYNIAITRDAVSHGFDEINFDYIRFASDGNLSDMTFPFYNSQSTKHGVIKDFFKYLRNELPGVKISADLFGLSTVQQDDLGIGQVIEDAYLYFDYVCPMVYPSHYASGFLGYQNPALYPYEVVKYSMDNALKRLIDYGLQPAATSTSSTSTNSTSTNPELLKAKSYNPNSKLRPWLQDFNLGANYNATMVRKQIKAVYDAASSTPELINGWMLWNSSNIYTKGALEISQ
jgi:hypothetical protein